MFIPTLTPESLAREILCRLMGDRLSAMNDAMNALKELPALHKVMSILLNPVPGQLITGDELNSAMTELLNIYNRNTENNPNLNTAQKAVGKLANQAFVSMVYDSIVSRLRIVSY